VKTYPPCPLPYEGRGCWEHGSPLFAGEGTGERSNKERGWGEVEEVYQTKRKENQT